MQIKTIPSLPVIYFTATTTLNEIGQYAFVIAEKLYAEAARQNVLPVGPVYWLYYNCSGNMQEPFTLEIALPLQSAPSQSSEFAFKELPAFKCVSSLYEGAWDKIGEAYDSMIGWTKTNGHALTNEFREAYIYMAEAYRLTEINVGIE